MKTCAICTNLTASGSMQSPLILLNDLRHSACLEAAQLVEEGLWP